MESMVGPRIVPDRDSRYMGLAWTLAGFSKDPKSQVGAVIVGENNTPLGYGYNGPPRRIDDRSFSWARTSNPEEFGKNDLIVHAEKNAISHSHGSLVNSILYVTALPCPSCMLDIVDAEIAYVIYMDYQSDPNSSLSNAAWREKTFKKAQLGRIKLEKFKGNINWIVDWTMKLKEMGVLDSQPDI